mgnify:FL=1
MNKEAFKEWRIIPSMLVDSNKRDLRTTIFGVEYSSPVMIAPVGVNGLWVRAFSSSYKLQGADFTV